MDAGNAERAAPRKFRNRYGDPLLFTTDRFDVNSGAAEAVAVSVAALDGAQRDETIADRTEYAFPRRQVPADQILRSASNRLAATARTLAASR